MASEAEWEKGALGMDGRIYPWGDEWDSDRCNSAEAGPGGTTLVGAYPDGASPYGLLDMAGNVFEWTRSLPRDYPYDPGDGQEDLEASRSFRRVLRGGAFGNFERNVRCAFRVRINPIVRDDYYGFRLVASPLWLRAAR